MITEIGVSPFALIDISAKKLPYEAATLWEGWFDTIRSHGAIMFASREDFAMMSEILEGSDFTVNERKRWIETLTRLKKDGRFRIAEPGLHQCLDEVDTPEAIARVREDLPLVAVLAKDAFQRLYPDSATGAEVVDLNTTTAVAGAITRDTTIGRLVTMAEGEVYAVDSPRDAIWKDLFDVIARRSKRVTMFDRYAFKDLVWREANPPRGETRVPEQIGWFLAKLDTIAPPGARVKIYTQLGSEIGNVAGPKDADGLVKLLQKHWQPRSDGRLAAIEVAALVWGRRDRHPHNRHIRFGEMFGYRLEEGLDRLGTSNVLDADGFNYHYRWRKEQLDKLRSREALVWRDPELERSEWKLHS